MKNTIVFIMFFCLIEISSYSQTTIPIYSNLKVGYYGPNRTLVKLDPISRIPLGNVPFDRNFIVRAYFLSINDIISQQHWQ